jgi:universal stress protein E
VSADVNPSIRNLLIVVDDALSMPHLMEKAERLADDDTRVHVVQVIHEGVAEISTRAVEDSAALKSFILSAAESALEDSLEHARTRFKHLESATLWNARTWEAALHAAADVQADVILRATGEEAPLGEKIVTVVRTPDEWNLLRHAEVPVLLAKAAAWPENPTVICALDVFDDTHDPLNDAVLRWASALAELLGGDLDLVYAYPLFEPWVGEAGALRDYAEIKRTVEAEARERVERITGRTGVSYRHLHLEEGNSAPVIKRLVDDAEAAMLVIGTHARGGVGAVLLGNTSERILHAVDCDVLTVTAPE